MRRSVFITAERLAAELRFNKPPVVLDARWSLAEPNGYPAYRAGHIPGAHFVDLETVLSGEADDTTGRHPLPNLTELQEAARSWGLDDGDAVVVYDDDGAAAARAWWVLKWAGIDNVRILDGGYRAWAGHGETVTGPTPKLKKKQRGTITLTGGHMPTIGADEAADFAGILLDARAPERFRGQYEPMDARAGHIPGAINAPYTRTLGSSGTLLTEPALREHFEKLGAFAGEPIAVYCGSGISATSNIAALASLGVEAALYPGSFSQWSADPARPVAYGD